MPRTDKEVLKASNGAVDLALIVKAVDLEPEKGGIFDNDITGGKAGSKWSHAKLTEKLAEAEARAKVLRVSCGRPSGWATRCRSIHLRELLGNMYT